MTPAHINPGTDTTINPVVIDDSKRSNPNKGELVYGSITKSGEDWRMRSFDAGMGETEYRIFKNEKFFAQFDNRKDADTVMELMTGATEAHPTEEQQRIDAEHEVIKAAMNWWMIQRPLDWSEEQHLKHPTINIFGNQERALAEAIALLQEGRK